MPSQEFTPQALQNQIWKPVVGYEGKYSVSEFGAVRSEFNPNRPGRGPILMRPHTSRLGYLSIKLCRDGRPKHFEVHTLVALAFLGPRPENREVNHKDGKKPNNHHSNLEYVTRSENMKHACRLGLADGRANLKRGPNKARSVSYPAKLTDESMHLD